MALVQCLGADVMEGELHFPKRGSWWANLRLDATAVPALKSQATIAAANGLSFTGSIAKAGIFNDVVYVHVVGGGGSTGVVVGPFSFQSCVLGDPLNAILSAARETLSPTVTTQLTRLNLGSWLATQKHAALLLNELCYAAQLQLGGEVNWRQLGDGTTWMGQETWPSSSLPNGADVLLQHPVNPWFEIGAETPLVFTGTQLADIGSLNVAATDCWIEHSSVRMWIWTS